MSSQDPYTLRIPQIAMITGLKRHAINARAKVAFNTKDISRSSGNQILLNPSQVKKLIEDRLNLLKGKIIYVGNLKGGVGKTTISYLMANVLSTLGLHVCAIDLDTQANLTSQFINVNTSQAVFFDVIEQKKRIQDVIINLSSTLDFIPSSLRNSLIQKTLSMQAPKHHLTWFNELCLNHLRNKYDVIIVDTPPHLTTLNSVFCLCLKENDHIVIPACAEDFSIMGVQMFLEDIMEIRESYKVSNSPKTSIIINKFLQNQKTNLEMLVKMGRTYSGMVSELIIKDSAKIRETINNKIPINDIKQGKEVFEILSNMLHEFNILKSAGA